MPPISPKPGYKSWDYRHALRRSISPLLSNLSLVTRLSLQGNNFHGEIPTTLGALSQLEYLNISENKLSGALPASLHGCQSLKFLDLSDNNLSGVIPEELGWMKKLGFFSSLCNQPHWGHSGLFVKPDRIDTTRTGCELLYWANPCGAWSFEQAWDFVFAPELSWGNNTCITK